MHNLLRYSRQNPYFRKAQKANKNINNTTCILYAQVLDKKYFRYILQIYNFVIRKVMATATNVFGKLEVAETKVGG